SLKTTMPAAERALELVRRTRQGIRDILHGRDSERLLVIVGPCSIHDADAAFEYARRLQAVAEAVRDRLLIVMRTYVQKPRTALGWKGLASDPYLDGSCDVAAGLTLARRILGAINELGVPCASELLDPFTASYVADLLSWAAIGARTSSSQTHREMASGLEMPVGFKNSTDGDLAAAVNGVLCSSRSQTALGIDDTGVVSAWRTAGNRDGHIVLRGGATGPNHEAGDVARASALLGADPCARPILIDCSHDNSGKDHTRQPRVFREVIALHRGGVNAIMGALVESNLRAGNQSWRPGAALAYGVSITDACIGWEETEEMLYEAAAG
ncbi:MAG: 3-deoxy-7-phosphoheptulonate synthase, partial [Candidatus Binatia bacterium]